MQQAVVTRVPPFRIDIIRNTPTANETVYAVALLD